MNLSMIELDSKAYDNSFDIYIAPIKLNILLNGSENKYIKVMEIACQSIAHLKSLPYRACPS